MSYLGWAKRSAWYVGQFNKQAKEAGYPNRTTHVLEIGVDRGQTALPLIHNLSRQNVDFKWHGVDIRIDVNFHQQLHYMDGVKVDENVFYIQQNSLDFLPNMIEQNPNFGGFDLIMIDGDHNYETVSKELSYLDKISHPYTMCVIDDYNGKHANRDDFYADKDTHKGLDHKDLQRESEKQGTNNAVNDFIEENKKWKLYNFFPDEDPVVLLRERAAMIYKNKRIMFSFAPLNI